MPEIILYKEQPPFTSAAVTEGNNLWLSLDELQTATGWELKPQGVCLGDYCVPIPTGRESEFLRADGRQFSLTVLARFLGQPVVHDDTHHVWFFGEATSARREALFSLQAPDFTLPDLDSHLHSLSDYRGKKIFLVSWASW
jgi:hypothetical protein